MTAYIEHVVTDMGNGAAYCGRCSRRLGSDPFNLPEECPDCGSELVDNFYKFQQSLGAA